MSFEKYFQVFHYKYASTLKSTGVVAYLVHVILMDSSSKYRCCLVTSGQTVVFFVPNRRGNELRERVVLFMKDGCVGTDL